MKFSLVTAPALLWLGLASAPFAASQSVFVVKPSGVAPPADILGEHQPLERSWTIYSTKALTSLTFQGSGTVFVDFDEALQTDAAPALPEDPSAAGPDGQPRPRVDSLQAPPALPAPLVPPAPFVLAEGSSDDSQGEADDTQVIAPVPHLQAVAKVVVSGDSEDLLAGFQVVASSTSEDGGLELVLNAGSTRKGGYALTQLFVVEKSALASVTAISSCDVVVGENVLITNNSTASLAFASVGSGDIFVTSNETLSVGNLVVFTAGSGDVQIQFATVTVANAIALNGVASGDIALLADDVQAELIESMIVGSADLFVQADNVSTANLVTFIGGSGSATVSKAGACVNQTVTVAGSGEVKTGSIACQNVSVSIYGSGDALVQATNKLSVTLVASGSVFRKHLDRRVTHVEENKFHIYKPRKAPAHRPQYVHGKKKHHGFHWWGIFGDDSDDSDDSDESSDSPDDEHHLGKHHFKIELEDGSGGERITLGDDGDDNEPPVMNLAASAGASSRAPSAASIVGVFGAVMGAVGVAAYKYKQRRARKQYIPLF